MTSKRTASIESRLASSVAEIDRIGHADVLCFTVLERWLLQPPRLRAVGFRVATQEA